MSGIAPESAATVYLGTAIEELDAALGIALPKAALQITPYTPFSSPPHTFMSFLMHRLRRGHPDPDTPTADNHGHITSPH
jgi:hypothetical protein